MKLEKDDLA